MPEPLAPSPQPLAIVGASARAAAASAARAGFRPLAADLFADEDLRAIATTTRISPYPDGLLDWLRAVEPAAWIYTGALENHPELVDQMAWIAPLWGNSGDVLARVRSPWELARALNDAGLLFPETRSSHEDLPLDGSWLAKTYRGASGSGVRELNRENASSHGVNDVCFQKRVAGIPCAAAFAAHDGNANLIGVTRQLIGETWLGAHGFQYAGSIGPLPIQDTTEQLITRIGQVLTERFELVGVFGIDFVLDADNRVWPIEVNPRYTASMEICERITGLFTIAAHIDAWRQPGFEKLPAVQIVNPDLSHGKAILFAKRDITLSQSFVEEALQQAMHKPWPMLADIPSANTLIEAGRPILTLFAEGNTVVEVECRLRERAMQIERQLEAQ